MADITTARKADNRPVHTFKLPEDLVGIDEYIKESIGLVKLRMSEEIKASEIAASNQTRLAYAMMRMALVEVDGRKVNRAEGEDETILENTDPAIRELLILAFTAIASSKGDQAKKFLASRETKV